MIGYCTLGSGECHCYDDTTPCPYWVGDCVTPQEFGAVSESGPVAAETIEEMKRRYLAMQAAEYRIDAANLAVLGETIKCSPGEIEEYGFDPQRYIESGGEWVSPGTTLEHLRNTIEAAILDSGEAEAFDFAGFYSQVPGEKKVYADEDTLQPMQVVTVSSGSVPIGGVTVVDNGPGYDGGRITVTITNGGPWYKAEYVPVMQIADAGEDEPDIAEITRNVARGS